MSLPPSFPDLEQLPACLSGGGHNGIFSRDIDDVPEDLFPCHRTNTGIFHLFLTGQRTLPDDERHALPLCKDGPECLHYRSQFFFRCLFSHDAGPDIHVFQQTHSHFSLIDMLRFIMNSRLSSPSHDENHRDRIYPVVQKGSRRIDDVAFSGILHVDHRNFAGGEVIAGSQRRTVSLIRPDHMVLRIGPVGPHQIIAERLQLRIRDTRIKIRPQDLRKCLYIHTISPPASESAGTVPPASLRSEGPDYFSGGPD